jgi:geranylgeranyl pyrophosphate synthase
MPSDLQQEAVEVEKILVDVADTLHPVLSDFIREELASRKSRRLALVVLAAAYPETDTDQQRQQRVCLAAAIELLAIALGVHKLLLNAADLDRSLVGGTVLAGDYCFSRAAALAARTENPAVVAIFSELLQQLSEGHLRVIFSEGKEIFDEGTLLHQMAALAGAVLADLATETVQAVTDFGRWTSNWPDNVDGASQQQEIGHRLEASGVPSFQHSRWVELFESIPARR